LLGRSDGGKHLYAQPSWSRLQSQRQNIDISSDSPIKTAILAV